MAMMLLSLSNFFAQNKSVSIGSLTPDNSALLDLESNTQGFLMTRLDSLQIKAIANPANGLVVFNLEDQCFWYKNKNKWERICTTDSLSNNTVISNYINAKIIYGDTGIFNYIKVVKANLDTIINTYIASRTTKTDSLYVGGTPVQTLISDSIVSAAWLLRGNKGTSPPVNFLGTRDNKDLVFGTNNSERMRVLAGGDVGIGTSSPLSNLEVLGLTGITANRFSTDANPAQVTFKKARGASGTPSTLLQNDMIGQVVFMGYTFSGTPYLPTAYISASVTDPAWSDFSRGTDLTFSVTKNATSIPFEALRIDNNGNVGIGCSTPHYVLDVQGTLGVSGQITTTSAVATTGFTACSDIRFKTNIVPLQNSLQNVLKLQGVNYIWRINEFPERHFANGVQIGFIAQEIEKIYPQFVLTDDKGFKSVDYSRLTPVLVEAIKEQQKMIEDQQSAIAQLEAKNNCQQSEIEKMKSENLRNQFQFDFRLKKLEELLSGEAKK